jgi:hypothetical protein
VYWTASPDIAKEGDRVSHRVPVIHSAMPFAGERLETEGVMHMRKGAIEALAVSVVALGPFCIKQHTATPAVVGRER